MVVAVPVNGVDSPATAWTAPTTTESAPATTTIHPTHRGYSWLHATARP